MGRVNRILAAAALACLGQPLAAEPMAEWDAPIAEASLRFGVPVSWIRRVMRAESGGRTMLDGRPIRSKAGAMGLMQLMPGTWQEMRAAHGLGPDPHDPRDNILAGTAYLRAMYDRFGYPGLFGAYNAGPARYADHLARSSRLPQETVAYMATIAGPRNAAPVALAGVPSGSPGPRTTVFFPASAKPRAGSSADPDATPPSAGLFLVRRTAP